MTTNSTTTINSTTTMDETIRTAAIAKGYSDASVVTQIAKDRPGTLDVGSWSVLSIKRSAGGEWELLGRRRTPGELLELLRA